MVLRGGVFAFARGVVFGPFGFSRVFFFIENVGSLYLCCVFVFLIKWFSKVAGTAFPSVFLSQKDIGVFYFHNMFLSSSW